MTSEGPNSPGTLADAADAGTSSWTTVSNAGASDDAYAVWTADYGGGAPTDRLKATNFGFSIPAGATIDGILVEVEGKHSGLTNPSVNLISLLKDGIVEGGSKNGWSNLFTTTDAYYSFGGAADVWGGAWTASDINSSSFGTYFNCYGEGNGATYIDHVRITVYYTEASGVSGRRALLGVGF